jgi:hypothetical protein
LVRAEAALGAGCKRAGKAVGEVEVADCGSRWCGGWEMRRGRYYAGCHLPCRRRLRRMWMQASFDASSGIGNLRHRVSRSRLHRLRRHPAAHCSGGYCCGWERPEENEERSRLVMDLWAFAGRISSTTEKVDYQGMG